MWICTRMKQNFYLSHLQISTKNVSKAEHKTCNLGYSRGNIGGVLQDISLGDGFLSKNPVALTII